MLWKPKYKNHTLLIVSKPAIGDTKDKKACVGEIVKQGVSSNLPPRTNPRATNHLERLQTALLDIENDVMELDWHNTQDQHVIAGDITKKVSIEVPILL